MRVARLLAFVVVPAAFVALLALGLTKTTGPKAVVGGPAPDFALPVLGEARTLSSADLRGSPLVVNFWASWCLPCREEAPELERAWRRYRGQGVRFVGVNVQDAEDDAKAFVKEFGITFPSVRDANLELWGKFGVRGLPETFFIDRRWRFSGLVAGDRIGASGGTKILGAIRRPELESRLQLLLRRDERSETK